MSVSRLFSRIAVVIALVTAACAPKIQALGEVRSRPALVDGFLRGADGARLPVRRWPASGAPNAIFIALHGFNDYSRAFSAPAEWWAAAGITTYAFDQRGFGDAAGRGIWAGTGTMIGDLDAMIAAVRARHPGIPLFLLGTSMGGAVSMARYRRVKAAEGAGPGPVPVSGMILVAPAVWGWSSMNPLYRAMLWTLAHVMPWKHVTGGGLDITPSDNIEMLRALGRDPKVIKETRIDAVYGLTDLMESAYRAAPGIDVPVLLLYGGRDEIIPREPIEKVAAALPGDACFVVYPEGYHMLLRDLGARSVWRDVLDWARTGQCPSA